MDLMSRRRMMMATGNAISMIESLFLGFTRIQDIVIPENSMTNAYECANYLETAIGRSDNFVISLLSNPNTENQIVSMTKLNGSYMNKVEFQKRYRGGSFSVFPCSTQYDAILVPGTKYAVYEVDCATTVNPYE